MQPGIVYECRGRLGVLLPDGRMLTATRGHLRVAPPPHESAVFHEAKNVTFGDLSETWNVSEQAIDAAVALYWPKKHTRKRPTQTHYNRKKNNKAGAIPPGVHVYRTPEVTE